MPIMGPAVAFSLCFMFYVLCSMFYVWGQCKCWREVRSVSVSVGVKCEASV
jgi:hypothetical protein